MNLQSSQPYAPFETVLDALLDVGIKIEAQHISRLSDLEGESHQKVVAVWPQIALERRLALLEEMDALVEENHILCFESISKIAIHDDDPQARFLAVRSLAIYETTELIPDLLQRVENDSDVNVRAACAFSLGRFAYLGELDQLPAHTVQDVQACLLNIFNGDDEDIVRRQALESLGFITHINIPAIIQEAVESKDVRWQASALCAMGRSCDSRWADQIETMLDNPTPLIRIEAARAAGELSLSSTKLRLLELLDDGIPEMRLAVIKALSQIGGEGINETLNTLLEQTQDDLEADFIQDAVDNLAVNEDNDFFGLVDFDDNSDIFD